MTRIARITGFLCILAIAAGCGNSDVERVAVHGNVAFNGQPVQNGEIRFYPTGETRMPMSGAPIVNGEYEVQHRGGVPVGSFRVEIEAFRAGAVAAEIQAEGGAREQFLPSKYNIRSELSAEVPSGVAELKLDFLDLRS